jgi:serine/threonine-protein kinase
LPGGQAVLFTIVPVALGADASQVAVRDLRTGAQKVLVREGSDPHYVASGHLVYTAGGGLYAVLFDLRRLEVRGTPVAVVPQIVTASQLGGAELAVAPNGTLAYLDPTNGVAPSANTLVWVDRAGQEQPIAAPPPHPYLYPRLSPDTTRVAVSRLDQGRSVWIWDFRRKTLTPLTADLAFDSLPIWTPPDGHRVVFQSNRESGTINLWWQATDGTGTVERLTTNSNIQAPTSISADGKELIFQELTSTMGVDLMRLFLDGSRRVTPVLQTRANEMNGEVSPDGHWLAYQSDSSGHDEIYVRPYPPTSEGQRRISADRGTQPAWARGGKELFYLALDGSVMSVSVEVNGDIWRPVEPKKLFQSRYAVRGPSPMRMYDVSPDGQRFLMLKPAGSDQTAASPTLVIVQHSDQQLKRLLPTK